MRILVDADACPVKKEILRLAKEYHVPVTMVIDNSHELDDGYSTVITVDTGQDSADYKLISLTGPGDIVVTQDYGVASMALGKGAVALHQNGFCYTQDNIDQLLFERHLGQKLRRAGKRMPNPKRRTAADNEAFCKTLQTLLETGITRREG